ncbi:MAG: hypothetical protein ACLPKI_07405 [Streptosporangiaceae bacterium]
MTASDPPIVGLRREREVLTVALQAGRHVVIAAALARRGGGLCRPLRGLADVGPELTRVLS